MHYFPAKRALITPPGPAGEPDRRAPAPGTPRAGPGHRAGDAARHPAADAGEHRPQSTVSTAQSVGDTTQRVSRAAFAGLQTGQQVVAANTAKAVEIAGTAWTVIKHRKAVAAAAFATGRSTAKPPMGPLTRLARGRI